MLRFVIVLSDTNINDLLINNKFNIYSYYINIMAKIINSKLNDPCTEVGVIYTDDILKFQYTNQFSDNKKFLEYIWRTNGPDKMREIFRLHKKLKQTLFYNNIKYFPKYDVDISNWINKLNNYQAEILYKYLSCFIKNQMGGSSNCKIDYLSLYMVHKKTYLNMPK